MHRKIKANKNKNTSNADQPKIKNKKFVIMQFS